MQAIVQVKYGSADDLELRDIELPPVAGDEVLVRVRAASVHPDIWHFVSGRPFIIRLLGTGLFKPKYRVPGTDVAGVVESVGGQVTRFGPGDEVFGETNVVAGFPTGGAYAEYVSVRQDQLARKPANVSFEQAASVPCSGYIALSNLRGAERNLPGKRALINGAGGGVGMLALQIAKAFGAHVTAVDAPFKLELLRRLGADRVIDFTTQDFTRGDQRYDLIFDVPGNRPFSVCRRVLEPGGRYVLIGHDGFGAVGNRALGIFPRFFKLVLLSRFVKQLRGPRIPLPTRGEAITVLKELLETGGITPQIDSVYPLSEAPAAIRRMMRGELQGKVIIAPR